MTREGRSRESAAGDRPSPAPGHGLARRAPSFLAVLAAGAALAGIAAAAGSGQEPRAMLAWAMKGPFFSAALGGLFVLHALSRRSARERLAALAAGAVVGAALWLRLRGVAWDALLAGLGTGSILVLAVSAARAGNSDRVQALEVLLPGLVLPAFALASTFFLELTAIVRPTTYDLYAFHADQGFGLQPGFLMGRVFSSWPPLAAGAAMVYHHLPLAFAVVQGACLRVRRTPRPEPTTAFLSVAVAGYPLYLLFPLVGPVYLFPGYPWDQPAADAILLSPIAVDPVWRNCMPSLHTAWALMAFWLAAPLGRWVRLATGTFLFFTVLATLGLGYHYLVDLVVAVPFTAALYAALRPAAPDGVRLRRCLMAVAVGLVALWLAMIRFAPRLFAGAPAVQWALASFTVLVSVGAVLALRRREPFTARGSDGRAREGGPPLSP